MKTNQNDFTQDNPPIMTYPLLYVERTSGWVHSVYHFHYADTDKIGKTIKKTITDYDDSYGHDWVRSLIKSQLEQGGTQIRDTATYFFFTPMLPKTKTKNAFTDTQKHIMEGVHPFLRRDTSANRGYHRCRLRYFKSCPVLGGGHGTSEAQG